MSASEIADIIDLRFGFEKGKRFPPSLPLSDEIDFETLGYVKVYDC